MPSLSLNSVGALGSVCLKMPQGKRHAIRPGARFGRLTVVGENPERWSGYRVAYDCRCDCGNEVTVPGTNLRGGLSRSCGCLMRDRSAETNTRHGHNRGRGRTSATYNAWARMRSRCLNPNDPAYTRFGGRGIGVAERWSDFANFLADMGEKPADMMLGRTGPGDFGPGNCAWVPRGTSDEVHGTRASAGRHNEGVTVHGHGSDVESGRRATPTYASWAGAKNRCRNPRNPKYIGDRVHFAERWDEFANFLEDMGEKPDGTRLKRIDPDRGYEPGNCEWRPRRPAP